MFQVSINGHEYSSAADKTLLRFLRDDLRLTAAKDGCGEGVCGTCTVLVDGVKKRACLLKLSQLDGKAVLTVEGIPAAEMRLYEYCFAAAGAVQCGFCIPGMIISAKALLDSNGEPSREQVKQAIKGNICRCTGYRKIEDAILMAAEMRRSGREIPPPEESLRLMSAAARFDAAAKVNGSGRYSDDLYFPDMVYAGAVFSRYPRARVEKIDIAEALAHPACLKILTRADVPCNKIGHEVSDQDVMIGEGEITKFVGNVLAVAAAETREDLEAVLALIKVDYTELPPVTSPEEARRPDASLVHPGLESNLLNVSSVRRGDADAALRRSKYAVTRKYSTSWQEHGFLETECCVALPEGDDGLLLFTGCQSVYDVQRECAQMLGLPPEKVHCRAALIGGGFGGKEDMTVQPYAALMAWHLKRPVKFRFTRQQSLDYHVKRHPMEMEFTLACDENGLFTAMKGVITADTGAYASLGKPVIHRACVHAAGPYRYGAVDVEGRAYYTNNVPAGAFRGFGVAQSCFAVEMNIDLLAEKAGIDPWEMRRRNAVRPGDVLPNGQIAGPDTNLLACLQAIKPFYDAYPQAGLACGFKNAGIGLGRPDVGRVLLSVENGRVHVRTSAACMGQGLGQTMLTLVGEITGLTAGEMIFEDADTVRTPDAGSSSASRQTLITGEAACRAAVQLRDALQRVRKLQDLEGQSFYGEYQTETDGLDSGKEHPVSHVAYSYGAQLIVLDENGLVRKIISAFDVGTPVNVKSVEGQIEGGTLMGLGFAVSERYEYAAGYPQSRLASLGLLRADRAPEQEIILCVPPESERIPYALGAKGCGELCAIPTAPACAHAYYKRDGVLRHTLPLENTPYRR